MMQTGIFQNCWDNSMNAVAFALTNNISTKKRPCIDLASFAGSILAISTTYPSWTNFVSVGADLKYLVGDSQGILWCETATKISNTNRGTSKFVNALFLWHSVTDCTRDRSCVGLKTTLIIISFQRKLKYVVTLNVKSQINTNTRVCFIFGLIKLF